MPRTARIVIPGVPHHITQRGNDRYTVFFNKEDYERYLYLLSTESQKEGVEVLGYCLMPNHTHLIVVPPSAESLAVALGRAHGDYSRSTNRKYERTGHLWQNRFYSCALDEGHLWHALRYVERNPVRARIVDQACDYPWSSARIHMRDEWKKSILTQARWQAVWDGSTWKSFLNENECTQDLFSIRTHTRSGQPWFPRWGQSPGTASSDCPQKEKNNEKRKSEV